MRAKVITALIFGALLAIGIVQIKKQTKEAYYPDGAAGTAVMHPAREASFLSMPDIVPNLAAHMKQRGASENHENY